MPPLNGIGAYAAHLPAYALSDTSLDGPGGGARPGGPQRSVAGFDEDAVTLAVEALRELPVAPEAAAPGPLLLATTASPYDAKTAASIVHEAVGLDPRTAAIDLRGHRSGASALDLVLRTGALAALSDVRGTRPGAPDELAQGDAAVALAPGDAAARLLGSAGHGVELLERWRLPGERHDRVWDERFTADVLVEAATASVRRALAEAGRESADIVVVSSSNARAAAVLRRALGGSGEDAEVERLTGFTGTAHLGLLLADALDRAEPGQVVLAVSATEGADAFVLEVADGVREARSAPAVRDQLAARTTLSYGRYLRWRGLIDVQGPARPAAPAPASPPMHRRAGWKFRLEGSRCDACDAVTTPPSRVCAACGVVAETSAGGPETGKVSLRDRTATVVSVTQDHLTTMPESQVAIVIADVDGGGRITGYATDCAPGEVSPGMRMRPTFRRLWTTDAIHNYFWKLRPWEGSR